MPQRNLPAWQRDSRFLDEVKGLSPFRLLEAESHDPAALETAVQSWAGLDPEVKDYLNARLSYNLLIGIDELRRRLDRGNNHLSNIRTGTRLTVEAIDRNGTGGFEEGLPEEDDFDIPMEAEAMTIDDRMEANEPLADIAAMQAFDALDESGGVYIGQEEGSLAMASPPAPRKRAAPKKKSRKRTPKANGGGSPSVLLDEDGNPVQP